MDLKEYCSCGSSFDATSVMFSSGSSQVEDMKTLLEHWRGTHVCRKRGKAVEVTSTRIPPF